MDMGDQRKKSRSLAFKNPMRLADEHAELIRYAREYLGLLLSEYEGPDGEDLSGGRLERVRSLLAEVEKP